MLRSVKIKCFQVHRALSLSFGKGITTITGRSDVGKSAILRALRWVCLNDFKGDDFIHHGAKSVKVMVTLANGARIVRAKTGRTSGNVYKLLVQGKKAVFRSFKNTVPKPIEDVLHLTDINFAKQHDSPFWFSNTPGEVSRRLNAVVDLSIIDTALSNVTSAVRQANERKVLSEQRLREAEAQYAELQQQRGRVHDFKALSRLRKAYAWKAADRDRLYNLLQVFRAHTIKEPPSFTPVTKAHQIWHGLDYTRTELEQLLEDIHHTEQRIEDTSWAAKEAEEEFHKETKGKNCPLCQNRLS